MLIELKGATLNIQERHTDIMAHVPQACDYCRRMTCFFVNKDGQTSCTDCQGGNHDDLHCRT
jgi:hypothetical protein